MPPAACVNFRPVHSIWLLLITAIAITEPAAVRATEALQLPPEYTIDARGMLGSGKDCEQSSITSPVPFANTNTCYWRIKFDKKFFEDTKSSSLFALDGDDALIIHGQTIDRITLYLHTLNHHSIFDPTSGEYHISQSSITDGFSDVHYAQHVDKPFGQKLFLIVTSSTITFQSIRDHLVSTGVAEQLIQPLYFPARFANLGTTPFPDRLEFATRLVFQTPEELSTILQYSKESPSPLNAFLVRGPGTAGDISDSDLSSWKELYHSGKLHEDKVEFDTGLASQLDRLQERLVSYFKRKGIHLRTQTPLAEKLRNIPAEVCRQPGQKSCDYDNPLGLYSGFECDDTSPHPAVQVDFTREVEHCFFKFDNPNLLYAIIGVNHPFVGDMNLATYTSWGLSTANSRSKMVIASTDSQDLKSSIADFVPANSKLSRDALYATVFSKNCKGIARCIRVPAAANAGFFAGRHVLDRNGIHAPNPDNLVKSRLLLFSR